MSKAYVDTTVLTNAVLKRNSPLGVAAQAALKSYATTQLPEYAIKEFKKGPLATFVWLHNKLATTRSMRQTITAIQRISATPQRYRTSTALEALAESSQVAGKQASIEMVKKYGDSARLDQVNCDECRLALKALIYRAWARHRRIASEVVQPLTCYTTSKPIEDRGLIKLEHKRCSPSGECCLGPALRADANALRAMKAVVDSQPPRAEGLRRSKALSDLLAKKPMAEKACDDLGDAVIAFFAPPDSTILSTNLRDFQPLSLALGKKVEAP
jgi:hypothetical protein